MLQLELLDCERPMAALLLIDLLNPVIQSFDAWYDCKQQLPHNCLAWMQSEM